MFPDYSALGQRRDHNRKYLSVIGGKLSARHADRQATTAAHKRLSHVLRHPRGERTLTSDQLDIAMSEKRSGSRLKHLRISDNTARILKPKLPRELPKYFSHEAVQYEWSLIWAFHVMFLFVIMFSELKDGGPHNPLWMWHRPMDWAPRVNTHWQEKCRKLASTASGIFPSSPILAALVQFARHTLDDTLERLQRHLAGHIGSKGHNDLI
jgi:hypothetical protein